MSKVTENYKPEGVYATVKGKGGETRVFPKTDHVGQRVYVVQADWSEFDDYYPAVKHAIECVAVPKRAADSRPVAQDPPGATS